MEHGARLDIKDNLLSRTPVDVATHCDNLLIFNFVVNHKLDTDDRGNSALHRAVWSQSVDDIKYLLSHGVDMNVYNNKNQTPYDVAVSMNGGLTEVLLMYAIFGIQAFV